MALNAVALLPELTDPVPNLNDDAEHVLFIEQAADAWARGQNPLDMWVAQLELGFPQFLYYQNLPHQVVLVLDRLTFGLVQLRTLFDLVRYVLLVTFPLTVLWSMRRIGFSDVAAAIGAAAASLLSGSHRYGFEYDSYVWRGFGVYTQIFGMHLSFVALATLHRVATRGSGVIPAALACAGLALSHLIYAYMTAISAVALLLFGITRANAVGRVLRFGAVGAIAGVIGAYMWVPFFAQAGYLSISPYLQREKFDSFGAPTILTWLVTGDLLDHGRVPILTVLLAAGVIAAVVTRARPVVLSLALFVVWLVLYFGRPTLGPVADLLPLHEGLLFHRFIGGVDLFAILLIGAGGGWLWQLARTELTVRRLAVATAATIVALTPALAERWSYYADNTAWMRATGAAIAADVDAKTVMDTLRAQPPGRAYAGLPTNWGGSMNFGIPFRSVLMYNLLAHHGIDAVAKPYRGASLNADLLFDFDDQDLAHYRLFNVDYVVAPRSVVLPRELRPLVSTPKYVLYAAPGGGYVEYAGIARSETPSSQLDLFNRGLGWLRSGEPARWTFARYEYRQSGPGDVGVPLATCERQEISYERVQPGRIDVLAACLNNSAMVLKTSYHPNWRVTVDGREAATFMVSPSYLGFAVPAGQHFVTAEYRSAPLRTPLFALGALALAATLAFAARDRFRRPRIPSQVRPRLRHALLWLADSRPGTWAAIAVVAGVVAICWAFTTPIGFNGGLGNDGQVYAVMVRELRGEHGLAPAPPWVYRLFPVWLVAVSPLDVRTGFVLINLASIAASAALLVVFLRRYAVAGGMMLLAAFWWATLPMGPRWDLYYPVLPDALGFALLLALLVTALAGRYALFALALVAAVLTRENLLMLVPFLWLANLARGWRHATVATALAAAPAVIVFFWVRFFPVIIPADVYPSWLASHRIDVNLARVTQNIDGHAWRYVLAAPLSLGLLFAIPVGMWRRTLLFLRRELHWAYFVVATFALALIGGWDDDRYLFVLAPLLLVLVFGIGRDLWGSPWRIAALTLLQLLAVRFLWPTGPSEREYFQYTVAFMDQQRMWAFAAVAASAIALAAAAVQLRRRSQSSSVGRTMLHQSLTRRILE